MTKTIDENELIKKSNPGEIIPHSDPPRAPIADTPKNGKKSFTLTPKTMEEAIQFAEIMARSSLVPKDFQGKKEDILVAVQLGLEVGLQPMQAIQNIAVINGRPTIWGDAVLGIIQSSSVYEWHKEVIDAGKSATCTFKRKGNPHSFVRTFTMEMAKAAGLVAKGGVWKSYPDRMLQMRARAWAARDGFADVLRGLAVREEVEDYVDTTATVEPLKEPQPVGKDAIESGFRKQEYPAIAESESFISHVVVKEVKAYKSGTFEVFIKTGESFKTPDKALAKLAQANIGNEVTIRAKPDVLLSLSA